MVGSLVYYSQTAEFFDSYYDEIETIRDELTEQGIMPNWPDGDIKNWLAWLAFEEVARRMVHDILELDI